MPSFSHIASSASVPDSWLVGKDNIISAVDYGRYIKSLVEGNPDYNLLEKMIDILIPKIEYILKNSYIRHWPDMYRPPCPKCGEGDEGGNTHYVDEDMKVSNDEDGAILNHIGNKIDRLLKKYDGGFWVCENDLATVGWDEYMDSTADGKGTWMYTDGYKFLEKRLAVLEGGGDSKEKSGYFESVMEFVHGIGPASHWFLEGGTSTIDNVKEMYNKQDDFSKYASKVKPVLASYYKTVVAIVNREILAKDLLDVYEIHYKLQMLNSKPFTGPEKRQYNMIKKLEDKGLILADEVLTEFGAIYSDWLSKHAILNPQEWAEARLKETEEIDDSFVFGSAVSEYMRYTGMETYSYDPRKTSKAKNQAMVNMFGEIISKSEALQRFLDDYKQDIVDGLKDEINEDDDKKTVEMYENMEYDDLLSNFINLNDMDSIGETFKNYPDIIRDIYQYAVFPIWYGKWSAEGIDETRTEVENTFNAMQSALYASDIKTKLMAINKALNTTHQTGDMLDYVGEEHQELDKNLLDNLSAGDTAKWNEELRRMGVEI